MLRKITVLGLLILLSACSLRDDAAIEAYRDYTPHVDILAVEYRVYKELFSTLFDNPLTDADILGILVSVLITYTNEEGEYWKSAEETWYDRTGDCEDFCTLFLGLLQQEGIYDGQSMIVINPDEGDPWTYHVKIADRKLGIEYELTSGLLNISPLRKEGILREYSYAEVMYQAYEKKRLDWVF